MGLCREDEAGPGRREKDYLEGIWKGKAERWSRRIKIKQRIEGEIKSLMREGSFHCNIKQVGYNQVTGGLQQGK